MGPQRRTPPVTLVLSFIVVVIYAAATFGQGLFYGIASTDFPASPLKVDSATVFTEPITIEIDGFKDGRLVTAPGSIVPTRMRLTSENRLDLAYLTHGVNVTWVFKKRGMIFDADGSKYLVQRAGATIRFTQGGVMMDGIKKQGAAILPFLLAGFGVLFLTAIISVIVLRKRRREKSKSKISLPSCDSAN